MTYMLLIYLADPARHLYGDDAKEAIKGHREVQAETAERGELRAVAKLFNKREAKTVSKQGEAHVVTDAPYLETKEWLIGFYLVDCESEDEALAHARRICPDDGHAVEVRPVEWTWRG